ncbi:hypothetical protein HHK36_010310 [Tetracentron sinense]|uniref:TFIIS N-terminal domain-containing protein n=1 Tax=Tetracentron sinense TaxID=13715 RepID=A0A834ZGQ3_TETSI|nr:hypothetical protein HHK36_010310 [Tetracentron sinense]
MTLEDFFTLTEMKDGLTALARVEELVTVMQRGKNCVVKNISEASRQWSTVASTLAATENKDCLDLFIQLDGLWFLGRWLQEAQKCSNDTTDVFVEESMTALLGALEMLPIDKERSISSGIGVTVENLFGHKSFRIQDRARALFDSWNQGRDNDADHQYGEKDGACHDDKVSANAKVAAESGCPEHSATNVSPSKESTNADDHVVEPAGGKILQSSSPDGSQPERVKDVKIPRARNQDASCTTFSLTDKEGEYQDAPVSSIMLNPGQESLSVKEESFVRPSEGATSTETCSSPVPEKGNVEGKFLDVPKLKGFIDDGKGTHKLKGFPDNFNKTEISSVMMGPVYVFSTADPANVQESVMESAEPSDADAKERDFFLKKTTPLGLDSDTGTLASKLESGGIERVVVKHSRSTVKFKATNQGDESYPNVLQDLSSNGCILRNPEDPKTSVSRMEDVGAVKDVKELASETTWGVGGGEDSKFAADVLKQTMDTEYSAKIDKRRSGTEIEYGLDDALEVAQQVAKEVEREVKDCREPFCSSSSENNSEGGVRQLGSPDSINGEQDQHTTGPPSEGPTEQNLSSGASPPKGEEHSISSNNMDTKPEDCRHNMGSSQVTEAAEEPSSNTEKGICGFDLNEDVHSEEMDRPTTPISAPISVVAASRAVAACGLPVAPLQFEGALGWKGCAATSAFHPASSRRISYGDKTLSVEGSSYSSMQRQNLLDIDLNMVDGDDGDCDPISAKQIPVSSGFHSGESSIEVSSRRAERLKFDLNRVGNNDDAPSSDWRMEGRSLCHHRNGHHSPSPVSSSSSRQPSMRNINLNDRPSFVNDSYDQQPGLGKLSSQDMNTYRGFKLDDPAISIMGTRVEVNRKEVVPQTRSFLPNGHVAESAIGANLARTGGSVGVQPAMAYTTPPPPMFGYNGLTVGPSMCLSPAVYGPGSVPYMVDSRGAPVVPHIMGSSSAVLPSNSQPPFLVSMTGPPSGLNGVRPLRPSLDLNSGLMMMEGGSRDSGGLRQLLVPGQGGLMEEHTRSAMQFLSSGMGMKRKEPDGGWDPYPIGHKQQPPWQ